VIKKISLLCFFFFSPQIAFSSPKPAYVWNVVSDGIRYTSFFFDQTNLHAFEIDPTRVRLDVITASDAEKMGTTIEILKKRSNALLAINGGFFTQQHASIGLLIQSGKERNRLHKTSWWSIFSMEGDTPRITEPSKYIPLSTTIMALQAGPRLVIKGIIPKLKEERAARSGIGITKEGKVIIAITEGAEITMRTFAEAFVLSRWKGGFECEDAMNLDGGSSSQLFAEIGKFKLSIPGRSRIPNGIAVFAK